MKIEDRGVSEGPWLSIAEAPSGVLLESRGCPGQYWMKSDYYKPGHQAMMVAMESGTHYDNVGGSFCVVKNARIVIGGDDAD